MANTQFHPKKTLSLHIRIIGRSRDFDTMIPKMVAAMQELFSTANVVVNLATSERMDLERDDFKFFNRMDVGDCNSSPARDQVDLATDFRDSVGATEVVVYLCDSVMGDNGVMGACSTCPPGAPMIVMGPIAPLYAMAHEIGHLLGLRHRRNPNSLMRNPAPDEDETAELSDTEIRKMRRSDILQ